MNHDTTEYTEEVHGYTIAIHRDEDASSPQENDDTGLFLVGYHRDFSVDSDIVTKDDCIVLFSNPKERDAEERARVKEIEKQYHVLGLEAYIHSGVCLALSNEGGFPDRQWDVSQLGAVFISKKEARTAKRAREMALGLIEEWNNYLSGNVYGFTITKKNPCKTCGHVEEDIVESCWGFYGDIKESGILEEARASIPK